MTKGLSLLILFVVIAAVLLITYFGDDGTSASLATSLPWGVDDKTLQQRNGDTSAASDLYGIGVRIGIYLQSAGMLVALWEESGKGYKIAVSANVIGILVAWSILMERNTFSFSEAYLVVSEIGCFMIPGGYLILDITTAAGEIVGSIGVIIAVAWMNAGSMWLFTTHYRQLPLLGTSNSGFFFARVRLDGWYRPLIITFSSIACVFTLLTIYFVTLMNYFVLLKCGDDEEKVEEAFKEAVRAGRTARLSHFLGRDPDKAWASLVAITKVYKREACVMGVVIWVFQVATCEMTIQWNGLTPENSLTKPGQTIPLLVGIIIAADGIFSILRIGIRGKTRSSSMRKMLSHLEHLELNGSDRGSERHTDLGTAP